jgi:hypothetical protein
MKQKPGRIRYLRIEQPVYESEAFRTLPPSAVKLWVDLRTQLNGYNNGRLDATKQTLARRGWTSPETIYRALNELLSRGLLARTRHGKPGPARICSLFRFTDLPVEKDEKRFVVGSPATFEYNGWCKKSEIRESNRCRFGNRTVADTGIEPTDPPPLRESNHGRTPKMPETNCRINDINESDPKSLNGSETVHPYSYQGGDTLAVGVGPASPAVFYESAPVRLTEIERAR